jgi:signal transduction histidine kinase
MQETMENLKSSFYEAEGARLQALEASRLKSEFLASMSHEIRTPLNAIIGFADLLLEEEKDDEKKEALLTIKKSANILFENITDVLDFSKIEAGKLRISKTEFLIRDVVDEIGPIIKLRLHGKDVAFDFKIDEALERPLISDRVRIRQILLNVLINSAKFTHKGHISLTITPAQEMEGVLFKIEDTGIGIPESEHTRVFEPFTQVEGGVTREYGGTGLGLAIAKRLVEMLGGRIWLESKPGDGTAIYFTVEV